MAVVLIRERHFKRVRILVLKDRNPGHYHIAQGVAQAIGLSVAVDVQELDLRPRLFFKNSSFTSRILPLLKWVPRIGLYLIYGKKFTRGAPVDIVISCGSGMIPAVLLIGQYGGAKTVFCGGTAKYDPQSFDLILTQSPISKHNVGPIVSTIMPSKVNFAELRAPKIMRSDEDFKRIEIAVLIGGPTAERCYEESDWRRLVEIVEELYKKFDVRWRITTSRRTPDIVLQQLLPLVKNGQISEFVDFNKAGPGSSLPLLNSDLIFVTEDSSSMISEAIASGRPVVICEGKKLKPIRFDEVIEAYIQDRKAIKFRMGDLEIGKIIAGVVAQMPRQTDYMVEISRLVTSALELSEA